jgi:hypothetical protein
MLVFGILLTLAAVGAAVLSLFIEDDRLQITPVAVILALGLVGAYFYSHSNVNLNPEIIKQVMVSLIVYVVVWIAECGYGLATVVGPSVGAVRTACLYGSSIGLLLAFSLMLVSSALRSRELYYCLGLTISTLLAGMLLPILDRHYSYPLTHCIMAIGYLTGVAIQWVQLQKAVMHNAAN